MEKERREYKRTLAAVFIRFDVESGQGDQVGFTEDISLDGAKLLSAYPLSLNDNLGLNIDIPNNPEMTQAEGSVRWVSSKSITDENGKKIFPIGIAFTYMDRLDRDYLREFLRTREEILK